MVKEMTVSEAVRRYSQRVRAVSSVAFAAVLLAATYIVVLPSFLLSSLFPEVADLLWPSGGTRSVQDADFARAIVLGSFVAPLFETILCQWLPIRILHTWLGISWWVVVVSSATIFAVGHDYNFGYIVSAFLIGLVLATGFALRDQPNGYPGTIIFVVHAMRNAIATALIHVHQGFD